MDNSIAQIMCEKTPDACDVTCGLELQAHGVKYCPHCESQMTRENSVKFGRKVFHYPEMLTALMARTSKPEAPPKKKKKLHRHKRSSPVPHPLSISQQPSPQSSVGSIQRSPPSQSRTGRSRSMPEPWVDAGQCELKPRAKKLKHNSLNEELLSLQCSESDSF